MATVCRPAAAMHWLRTSGLGAGPLSLRSSCPSEDVMAPLTWPTRKPEAAWGRHGENCNTASGGDGAAGGGGTGGGTHVVQMAADACPARPSVIAAIAIPPSSRLRGRSQRNEMLLFMVGIPPCIGPDLCVRAVSSGTPFNRVER